MQNGNGGAALNRQRIRYTPDGGSRMTFDVANDATSHTLTGLASETEYTIDVQLRNSVGIRNSQAITATTTAADTTPVLAVVADQSATVGTPFTFTLPAATSGNPPVTYVVTGRPSWLAFNATTRVLSGTPTAAATSALTYTATDDDGDAASRSFDLVASAALPDAPVAAFTHVVSDLAVQFTDTSTNTPSSWAWTFGDGNSSTAQSPSHTYASAGTRTVTLTATNAGGADSFSAQVTTTAPDLDPTAPDVGAQTATVGTAFTATLPVGTGGDPPLSYSVSGEPSWASFNATTRVLSGTPDAAGTHHLTYTVEDDDGDTDDTTFNLVVAAAPAPLVIAGGPPGAAQVYTASVFSPDGLTGLGAVRLVDCQVTESLDAIGSFNLRVAFGDWRAQDLLQPGRRVRVMGWGRRDTLLAEGYILRDNSAIGPGTRALSFKGSDLLLDFQRTSTLDALSFRDTPLRDALKAIIRLVPGWSLGDGGGLDGPRVTQAFRNRSLIAVLIALAENFGMHFRREGQRLVFGLLGEDSGAVLLQSTGNPAASTAVLTRLSNELETTSVENWVAPYIGNPPAVMTLRHATLRAPYPVKRTMAPDGGEVFYIEDELSIQRYGRTQVTPSPAELIRPAERGAQGRVNTANTLYHWAVAHLRSRREPQASWSASTATRPAGLLPGAQALVRADVDGKTILYRRLNATQIQANHAITGSTWSIELTSDGRRPRRAEVIIAQAIRQSGADARVLNTGNVAAAEDVLIGVDPVAAPRAGETFRGSRVLDYVFPETGVLDLTGLEIAVPGRGTIRPGTLTWGDDLTIDLAASTTATFADLTADNLSLFLGAVGIVRELTFGDTPVQTDGSLLWSMVDPFPVGWKRGDTLWIVFGPGGSIEGGPTIWSAILEFEMSYSAVDVPVAVVTVARAELDGPHGITLAVDGNAVPASLLTGSVLEESVSVAGQVPVSGGLHVLEWRASAGAGTLSIALEILEVRL